MAEATTVAPTTPAKVEEKSAFEFSGSPGLPFGIYGRNFGDVAGAVTLNGEAMLVTRWRDQSIKGTMSTDAKPGPVVVTTLAGAKFAGHFGPKK